MAENTRSTGTRTLLLAGGILLLVAAAVAASRLLLKEQSAAVASFPVKQGEFVISLHLKDGELEAVKSEQITSPQVHGQLKITHLFPEGEVVEVGDLVLEFDRVEFEKKVTEKEHELQATKAELGKTLANQGVEMARQEADIENKEASLRLAELQMEKMKFESFVDREEAKLKSRQAELALEQARKKIEAQRIVDEAERTKQELRVADEERGLERARKDLEALSIHAEKPGLVVYQRIWKGGRREKIRVGDEPWGGQTLITLPDLTRMQVKTWVNEVDVDKLEVGNEVLVRLDALPGPVFHGKISNIASLGHEKEGDKNVQVFDIVVEIDEEDARLKPGMTAACEVIVETIPPRPHAGRRRDRGGGGDRRRRHPPLHPHRRRLREGRTHPRLPDAGRPAGGAGGRPGIAQRGLRHRRGGTGRQRPGRPARPDRGPGEARRRRGGPGGGAGRRRRGVARWTCARPSTCRWRD